MGEAKKKANELRRQMLMEIERWWTTPSTEYERALAQELSALPVVTVMRPPRAEFIRAGMKPQECHQNCASYCHLDPEKKSSVVPGWLVKGDNYISHSVVSREGVLFCVTPTFGTNVSSTSFLTTRSPGERECRRCDGR